MLNRKLLDLLKRDMSEQLNYLAKAMEAEEPEQLRSVTAAANKTLLRIFGIFSINQADSGEETIR